MKRPQYTPADFAWTKWSASDIKALAPNILAEKKARLSIIKKVPAEVRNFENTVYAIEASDYGISETILKIDLLQNVSLEKAIRDAAKRAIETIEKQMIRIERDPKIWAALKEYERGAWQKEGSALAPEAKKLFHDMFLNYKRMGFDLAPKEQERLKEIMERLAKISNEFRHNINSYKDHIIVRKEEAAGLPPRYTQGLKRDKKENYIITLAYPDYVPFMELAQNESKREELNNKYLHFAQSTHAFLGTKRTPTIKQTFVWRNPARLLLILKCRFSKKSQPAEKMTSTNSAISSVRLQKISMRNFFPTTSPTMDTNSKRNVSNLTARKYADTSPLREYSKEHSKFTRHYLVQIL